jgi:hypothetical protein
MSLAVIRPYASAPNNPAGAEIVASAGARRASSRAADRERPPNRSLATDPLGDTNPARGFVNGVLLAVPLWSVIGLLIWSFLK